mgnify:CR=1 FL=1
MALSNNINIRISDLTLSRLDELVTKNGYKSRSDCIKSLIEEKYLTSGAGVSGSKEDLVRLLQDPDVEAAIRGIVLKVLAEKKVSGV